MNILLGFPICICIGILFTYSQGPAVRLGFESLLCCREAGLTFIPGPQWDWVSFSVKWRAIVSASELAKLVCMKHSAQASCIAGALEMGRVNSLLEAGALRRDNSQKMCLAGGGGRGQMGDKWWWGKIIK